MTLCVAGFGQDKIGERNVVCCSDMRTETRSTGSETIYKFRKLSDQLGALYAGSVARADELMAIYVDYFSTKEIPARNAIEEFRKPPQILKRRLVEEYVQNTLALSYDDFLSRGTSLPPSLYENATGEIARMDIGCQLILIPVPPKSRNLFTVDENGNVYEEQNFTAIGSGASNAIAWLHYRNHGQFTNVDTTLLHVWEAKKFSENAPGVGKQTNMVWIEHDAHMRHLRSFARFEQLWKKFGPKNAKGPNIEMKSQFHPERIPWTEVGVG